MLKLSGMVQFTAFADEVLEHLANNAAIADVGDASGLPAAATVGSLYLNLHPTWPGRGAANQGVSPTLYTGYAPVALARDGSDLDVTSRVLSNLTEKLFAERADSAKAASATVAAGGTGYAVNDTLTVSGGTLASGGVAATFNVDSVSGGVVTAVSVVNVGGYTATPANPAATTGGGGSGCTLTVTYDTTNEELAFWSIGKEATASGSLPMWGGHIGGSLFGFDAATSDTLTLCGTHGLVDDDRVTVFQRLNETFPTGIAEGTLYYVINQSGQTLELSTTQGGSAVDITVAGCGQIAKVEPLSIGQFDRPRVRVGALVHRFD